MKTVLVFLLLCSLAHAAKPIAKPIATPTPESAPASSLVRDARPISVAVNGLGETPYVGGLVDINLWPYTSIGAGLGYFSVNSANGTVLPVLVRGYFLPFNLAPYLETGLAFISVKVESKNKLLNSDFSGIQWIAGGGAEYRADFGLVLRVGIVRYINAKIWIPSTSVGYSFAIP